MDPLTVPRTLPETGGDVPRLPSILPRKSVSVCGLWQSRLLGPFNETLACLDSLVHRENLGLRACTAKATCNGADNGLPSPNAAMAPCNCSTSKLASAAAGTVSLPLTHRLWVSPWKWLTGCASGALSVDLPSATSPTLGGGHG